MQSSHFTFLRIIQDVYSRAEDYLSINPKLQPEKHYSSSLALLPTFCIVELEK